MTRLTLVFDTETTGIPLHPAAKDSVQPRIIEWGGVLVDSESGEEVEALELLINPGVKLPPKITSITGITDDDLVGAATFAEAAPRLRPLFQRADALLAHNLPFDYTMMQLDLARAGVLAAWPWPQRLICTVQEHAEEWGRRPKLTELYKWYFGEPLAQTHRALDDVRALARIALESGVMK